MNAAGLDTTESAAKIKLWQDREKDFLKQTGLKKQGARAQIAGYSRSEAGKAGAQARQVQKVADKYFNLGSSEKNMSKYLREKSVIDILEANDIKYIQRISAKEIIVDAGKPTITGVRVHAVDNLTNKADRADMTLERAQTFVDSAKLTLYQQERNNLKFLAQDGYAIVNFKHELVTAVPQKWRRKYDKYA